MKRILTTTVTAIAAIFTLETAANAGISFTFDYSSNTPNVGFLDPVEGSARRAAVETAAELYSSLFSSHFSNSGTLSLSLLSSVDPADPLAYADSAVVEAPGTFGGGAVMSNKLINGTDLNSSLADGTVFFNFQMGNNWELNANASVDDGEISFYNAMFHEFTHALGFASYTLGGPQDPFGQGSPGSGSPGTWAKWDAFITDGTTLLINPVTFEVNQTAFDNTDPNFTAFFSGPNAVAANGGPVSLSTQRSHLDDNLFPTALMKSGSVAFPGPPVDTRVFNDVEVGILTDLGYSPVPEPSTTVFGIIGMIGLLIRRTRGKRA